MILCLLGMSPAFPRQPWRGFRCEFFRRHGHHKREGIFGDGLQPSFAVFFRDNDEGALFVLRPVEAAHDGVAVGVEGQQ